MAEVDLTSRRLWASVAAVLLAATLIGVLFQASFGHFWVALLIGGGTGVAAIVCVVAKEKRAGALCGAAAACAILSIVIGFPVREKVFSSRMAWCEARVAQIEDYKRTHGTYPTRLADAMDMSDVPSWVRSPGFEYKTTKDAFIFDIWDGPLSGFYWSSTKREWSRYD